MRKHIFVATILWLSFILASCESVQAPVISSTCHCEQLPSILPLRGQIGEKFSNQQFLDWVNAVHQVSDNRIEVDENDEGGAWKYSADYVWEKDRIEYRAELEKSTLIVAWADYVRGVVPSTGCVVTCFGPPDQYRAYYTLAAPAPNYALKFDMLYPELGLEVSGTDYYELSADEPPPITEQFPSESFTIVTPGTAEDIILQIYHENGKYEKMFKSWPGSWEDVVIEEGPAILE